VDDEMPFGVGDERGDGGALAGDAGPGQDRNADDQTVVSLRCRRCRYRPRTRPSSGSSNAPAGNAWSGQAESTQAVATPTRRCAVPVTASARPVTASASRPLASRLVDPFLGTSPGGRNVRRDDGADDVRISKQLPVGA